MELDLLEVKTGLLKEGVIEMATFKEMPLKKDGWQFNWRVLAKTEGVKVYKCILKDHPEEIQGVIMLSTMYDEMLFMNNIEVAPHNLGKNGTFHNVAGGLIGFACLQSFDLGKGNYKGYLSFDSKTELIELYQERYGATLAMKQRMFIDPEQGKILIDQYLNKKV
jgi:hypothetical protein